MIDEDEPALRAPVTVERDERSEGESMPPTFERSTDDRYLNELMRIRFSQERTERGIGEVKDELGGVRIELGEIKDFATQQALEIANVKGVEPNGLRGKTVLVVDDNHELLDILSRLLFQLGVQVVMARSRSEAEALILPEDNRFDAALIDLHLPHQEQGIELCRWICRMHPETGVIVMSGKHSPAVDKLPVARLRKPFSLKTLTTALYEVIGSGGPSLRPTAYPPPAFTDEPGTAESPYSPAPITRDETPTAKKQ